MKGSGGLPFDREKVEPEKVAEELARNPVAYSIRSVKERTQGRLGEDSVTRRARRLHAENSFQDWERLPDDERELWLHLARVDLLGNDVGTR